MRKEREGEREKGREMRFCDVQRSRSPRGSPTSAPGGRRSFQSVCLAVAVAVTVALACRSRRGAASAGTGGGLGLVRRVAVPGSLRMRMRMRVWLLLMLGLLALHCFRAELLLLLLLLRDSCCTSGWRATSHLLLLTLRIGSLSLLASSGIHGHSWLQAHRERAGEHRDHGGLEWW